MGAEGVLLEVCHLRYAYSGALAVRDVSLTVGPGEIVALLGPNGAGKTTTVKLIAGALRPQAGTIRFGGQDITGWPAHRVVEAGVTLVPEGRLLFSSMSVHDNLLMGAFSARARPRTQASLERVFSIFPRVQERLNQVAGSMSGGEQQMVAISRGLMAVPKLLMLDEPSLGLMPRFVQELFRLIRSLKERGLSILLVEQNVNQALRVADRAYVLEKGEVVLEGTGEELVNNGYVRRAYLGM